MITSQALPSSVAVFGHPQQQRQGQQKITTSASNKLLNKLHGRQTTSLQNPIVCERQKMGLLLRAECVGDSETTTLLCPLPSKAVKLPILLQKSIACQKEYVAMCFPTTIIVTTTIRGVFLPAGTANALSRQLPYSSSHCFTAKHMKHKELL